MKRFEWDVIDMSDFTALHFPYEELFDLKPDIHGEPSSTKRGLAKSLARSHCEYVTLDECDDITVHLFRAAIAFTGSITHFVSAQDLVELQLSSCSFRV